MRTVEYRSDDTTSVFELFYFHDIEKQSLLKSNKQVVFLHAYEIFHFLSKMGKYCLQYCNKHLWPSTIAAILKVGAKFL